jgi:glutathione S-transferase
MKLLASLASPYTRKVRVVLAEKRIACEMVLVDVNSPDSPVPEVNPLGKIPALVLEDGAALFDSRVIVEYLDGLAPGARLIPEDARDRVAVRRWEALADGVLDAGLLVRYESLRPEGERSADWTAKQLGKIRRGLDAMQAELGGRDWCHGGRYSLADVALACCLGWLEFRRPGGVDWRASHPDLVRHYAKLMERPALAETAPR